MTWWWATFISLFAIHTSSSDQGLNPGPWQWKHGVLTTGPPGISPYIFFVEIYVQICCSFSFLKNYLFICFWLCWVFVSVWGLSLVVASGGHSSSRCAGLSLSRPLVAEHRLQTRKLSNCGSRAQLLRVMWDLPRPGLEPVSPSIGRRILNHCATREALLLILKSSRFLTVAF